MNTSAKVMLPIAVGVVLICGFVLYVKNQKTEPEGSEITGSQWRNRMTEYIDDDGAEFMFMKFLYFIQSGFPPERAFDIVVNS